MNRIIYIVVMISLSIYSFAGVRYPKHQAGIGYSMISGAGIEYQIELNMKSALKTNFIAYYYGDKPPDAMNIYDVFGLEYQYNVYKKDKSRVYIFLGGSYWHLEDRTIEVFQSNDLIIEKRKTKMDRIWNFGIGPGYEFNISGNVVISAQVGLQYQISNEVDHISSFIDRNPGGTSFIGVGGGVSLRFKL